jgi:hypothetical protein
VFPASVEALSASLVAALAAACAASRARSSRLKVTSSSISRRRAVLTADRAEVASARKAAA